MLAYVDLIQKKEKAIGCDVFTHQKWSGASYSDRVLNGTSLLETNWYLAAFALSPVLTDRSLIKPPAVSAGSSATAAGGKDSTEHSF
jgi:isocitrate lyase